MYEGGREYAEQPKGNACGTVWLGACRKRSGTDFIGDASDDKEYGYLSNSPMECGFSVLGGFHPVFRVSLPKSRCLGVHNPGV